MKKWLKIENSGLDNAKAKKIQAKERLMMKRDEERMTAKNIHARLNKYQHGCNIF